MGCQLKKTLSPACKPTDVKPINIYVTHFAVFDRVQVYSLNFIFNCIFSANVVAK
jgi:hypothetical protein